MKKTTILLLAIALSILAMLSVACAVAPDVQTDAPPAVVEENPPSNPPSNPPPAANTLCGWLINQTETGAFSPVFTVTDTGQVISLDLIAHDLLINHAGEFPSSFIIYDPVISEGESLQGDITYELSGYSSYEFVGYCP